MGARFSPLRVAPSWRSSQIASGGLWTPAQSEVPPLAWWNADPVGMFTLSSGLVSSWRDVLHGYDLTASGSARPTRAAASFASRRAGVAFNGTTTFLEMTSSLGWVPAGAAPSEDWYLVDEVALASDTAGRDFGSWGTVANTSRRSSGFGVTTAWNIRMTTGTGVGTGTNTQSTTNAFGRHVLRYVNEPTQHWCEVDGVASTPTATPPGTVVARLRMGAAASSVASAFGQFIISQRLIFGALLTVAQADQVRAYLVQRRD